MENENISEIVKYSVDEDTFRSLEKKGKLVQYFQKNKANLLLNLMKGGIQE